MLIKLGAAVGSIVAFVTVAYPKVHPPSFSDWKQVVVTPGQTEWQICRQYCPNADTRDVIDAVTAYNHIDDYQLQPGELLWVPTQVTPARLAFFMPKTQ